MRLSNEAVTELVRAIGWNEHTTLAHQNVVALFDNLSPRTKAELAEHLQSTNSEPCAIKGCPYPAAYEAWGRLRDPILGTPTGHLQKVCICEEHKTHPWLVCNESTASRPAPGTDGGDPDDYEKGLL